VRRADADGLHGGAAGVAEAERAGDRPERAPGGRAPGPRDAKRADGEIRAQDAGEPEGVDGGFLRENQMPTENPEQRLNARDTRRVYIYKYVFEFRITFLCITFMTTGNIMINVYRTDICAVDVFCA